MDRKTFESQKAFAGEKKASMQKKSAAVFLCGALYNIIM